MSSVFKPYNPFKLVNAFLGTEKVKPIKKVTEPPKPKKKRGRTEYHFAEYITEMGFIHTKDAKDYSIYVFEEHRPLKMFWNNVTNDIYFYLSKKLVCKLNFVPPNRIFVEMLVKKMINNL